MNKTRFRWTAFALACLLLPGCRDKHEPVKPTVMQAGAGVPAAAS
jgi:hypothetical protein